MCPDPVGRDPALPRKAVAALHFLHTGTCTAQKDHTTSVLRCASVQAFVQQPASACVVSRCVLAQVHACCKQTACLIFIQMLAWLVMGKICIQCHIPVPLLHAKENEQASLPAKAATSMVLLPPVAFRLSRAITVSTSVSTSVSIAASTTVSTHHCVLVCWPGP